MADTSKEIASYEDLVKLCASFSEVHLFIGYGARAQYASVDDVMSALSPHILAISQRCASSGAKGSKGWLAVFGGDIAIEADPDLGLLMKRVKTAYGCKLLAVQSWGEPDKHVDYFFRPPAQFENVTETQDGQQKTVQKVIYGGTRNGVPVGGSRFYLGKELVEKPLGHSHGLLRCMFVMGGGAVALEEMAYADTVGVPWVYIPSRARHTAAYGSVFGPVHDWVKTRMDSTAAGKPPMVVGNGA